MHWQGQGNSGAPEREAQPGRRVSVEPEVCRSGLRSQAGGGCSIWTASWKGPGGTVDPGEKIPMSSKWCLWPLLGPHLLVKSGQSSQAFVFTAPEVLL